MSEIRKIRIGTTFVCNIEVITNGRAVPLDGRNITVQLVNALGMSITMPTTINGNIVSFIYEGVAQTYTGIYRVEVYENFDEESQSVFDTDAFELVSRSSMADYGVDDFTKPVVELYGTSTSYLHEWFSGDEKYLFPVNGRKLAYDYVKKYGNNGSRGWRVFFAILAPYWGYWEKGFKLKSYFGGGTRFMQFAVMTHFFDEVKAELRPARTRFRCSVAKYTHEQLVKKWNKQTKF